MYIIRRSGFEKHLTIKNCDKIFLKNILRLKIAKTDRLNRLINLMHLVKVVCSLKITELFK